MSELERIKMQADLTEILDKWLDKQIESGDFTINCCEELSRMMATAAMAVCQASTISYVEGARDNE